MRRTLVVFALLFLAIPLGVNLTGCAKSSPTTYCQGNSGPQTGQIYSISLEPRYYGKSLSYGQTSSFGTPSPADCKGQAAETNSYKWASSNQNLVDINPATGEICAGQWNRFQAGNIPAYTTCTPATASGYSDVTASAGGATSNSVRVYVHPLVANITIGSPSTLNPTNPALNCTNNPSSDCCPITNNSPITSGGVYDGLSCISQKDTRQIVVRAFDANNNNITCSIGHPSLSAVTSNLLTIDENGVATALQPGTTTIQATVSTTPSNAGYFSVCPPKSIAITTANSVGNNVSITPNTTETISTIVKDTKDVTITGLDLTYTSTTPTTVGVSASGILATFPSSAAITAYCEPPSCNPAPVPYLGYFNTGKPVVSNTIVANASGNVGTQLWVASTQSQYIVPVDFVLGSTGTPKYLNFKPNSMVITQDGGTIYLGTDRELITFSTASGAVAEDISVQGRVLAASPDNGSIVVTDPARKLIRILSPASTSTVIASFSGVAQRAAYSADSRWVLITASSDGSSKPDQLIVYNSVYGSKVYSLGVGEANDVVPTIPHVGAYIAGDSSTVGRSYCPRTPFALTDNDIYPAATNGVVAAPADRLAATNDGKHILGVRVPTGGVPILSDINVTLPTGQCRSSSTASPAPAPGTVQDPFETFTNVPNLLTIAAVQAAAVNQIIPASNSTEAFITYTPTAGATTTGTKLPVYKPTASGPGTITYVTLANGALAPLAGVFAVDNNTFYVGTSGDNLIHIINANTLLDASQFNPKIPALSGSGFAVPDLIVQKPRKTT